MYLTMGNLTIRICRWWHDTNDVSYQRCNKSGIGHGIIITIPMHKLKYKLEKQATGAKALTVKENRILWKLTKMA
jgi:hypothetical protein